MGPTHHPRRLTNPANLCGHSTSPIRYALAAAARGWHVFPLQPRSKEPLGGASWKQRATTDPARVRALFPPRRPLNYGIACEPSRLVVIDLDTPKPGERPPAEWDQPGIGDGADVLAALCERHGQPLPYDTFMVRTRRGGLHLYYTAPSGIELRNTQYQPPGEDRPSRGLGWLIDTRAHGGYVVGPGSYVATEDGPGSYEVLHNPTPAPLPKWLLRLLSDARPASPRVECSLPPARVTNLTAYADAALGAEVKRVLTSPEHGHNFALNKAAYNLGRLVGAGTLPRAVVEQALQGAGEAVHTEDSPRQIASAIRAGIDAGTQHPKRNAA